MKFIIFIALISICESASNLDEDWEAFKLLYHKKYNGPEEEKIRHVIQLGVKVFPFLKTLKDS